MMDGTVSPDATRFISSLFHLPAPGQGRLHSHASLTVSYNSVTTTIDLLARTGEVVIVSAADAPGVYLGDTVIYH